MEQHSPPGGLRIGVETWRQVRGLFDLEAQPPLQVKGLEAPLQTGLVRAASECGVANVERLARPATPLIGRQLELQRLQERMNRLAQPSPAARGAVAEGSALRVTTMSRCAAA
jgi:hypothetical protein